MRWYNRISESPTLLLRLEASLLTADSVRPGVGVDDRVEGLDVGGDGTLSVSFASRILVGKLVNKSWILSSSDTGGMCLGVVNSTGILDDADSSKMVCSGFSNLGFQTSLVSTGVIGLALEMGVSGDVELIDMTGCLLLDLRGSVGTGGMPISSDFVRTRNGATSRDGVGEGKGVVSFNVALA